EINCILGKSNKNLSDPVCATSSEPGCDPSSGQDCDPSPKQDCNPSQVLKNLEFCFLYTRNSKYFHFSRTSTLAGIK
ncbi:hypothetical protein, partial [Enterocloster citroniae]|uniref:hypothetical protein n=1 Tax=Enterocloster citroniae TaxID=358743 RepID=UPI00305BEF48|nr:hypothetical protein [Enterocloster citroniae]